MNGDSGFGSMSIQDLIEGFADAVKTSAHHRFSGRPRRANKAFDRSVEIVNELRSRGPDALSALLPLLAHAEPEVRLGAAARALRFAPEVAKPVLKELAVGPQSLLRFEAEMTLAEYEKGNLRTF